MIQISYLHPLDRDTVLSRLKKAAHQNSAKLSGIIADEFGLPKRFCQLLTARYGESLKRLAAQLTGETFEISSVSGFSKAMCTSGGVDLSCIDLSTMQAKKLPGIYVIGEALDIDGITCRSYTTHRHINDYICSVFCHQKIFHITFIFLLKCDKYLPHSGDAPVRISGYFFNDFQ